MKDVGDRGLVVLSLAVTLALGTVPASADVPLLVTREWLSARLSDTQLRIVDMSTEHATYRRGHIPGAAYLHVDDVRVAVSAGGYRLPTEGEGARLLEKLKYMISPTIATGRPKIVRKTISTMGIAIQGTSSPE